MKPVLSDAAIRASYPPTKVCNHCGETKPRTGEFFAPDLRAKDLLAHWCRECKRPFDRENTKKLAAWNKKHKGGCLRVGRVPELKTLERAVGAIIP